MMTRTAVDVFNQLTLSKASDVTPFESILQDHYSKFKYFYKSIRALTTPIHGEWIPEFEDTKLTISVSFETSTDADNFHKELTSILPELVCSETNHFTYSTKRTDDLSLNITVANTLIAREDEIYYED